MLYSKKLKKYKFLFFFLSFLVLCFEYLISISFINTFFYLSFFPSLFLSIFFKKMKTNKRNEINHNFFVFSNVHLLFQLMSIFDQKFDFIFIYLSLSLSLFFSPLRKEKNCKKNRKIKIIILINRKTKNPYSIFRYHILICFLMNSYSCRSVDTQPCST